MVDSTTDALPPWRFNALIRLAKFLVPRYRFKWPQMQWWDNSWFNQYLAKFDELSGMNTDRRWMVYQLLRLVDQVPGDMAECGVYRGSTSYLMLKVNSQRAAGPRHHYIFDSFEGLSSPGQADGSYWRSGALAAPEQEVANNLAEFAGAFSLHKGWIPQAFPAVEQCKFAFVHIDVDLFQPTYDSISFFYSRLNPGAILLCDDYGFTSCPGATKACDDFLADKPEKMVSLSGGGGFMIKGVATLAVINPQ